MGHSLSDFEGPPFDFSIECNLTKKQKYLIRQKFFNEKERLFGIELNYESITTDKNRKWFGISYKSSKNEGYFIHADSKKILKVLGEEYFLKLNKNLEKRRDELLKPYKIKIKTIEGIVNSAPIIKLDNAGIDQRPKTTIKIKEKEKINGRNYELRGAHFLTPGQKIKLDINVHPDAEKEVLGYSLLNNENKEVLKFEY